MRKATRRALAGLATAGLLLGGCTTDPDESPSPSTSASTPSSVSSPGPLHSPTRSSSTGPPEPRYSTWPVPGGTHPHDVAPAAPGHHPDGMADGGVWYTAQATGRLGYLDPGTGEVHEFDLGPGSRPHGVIVGPNGDPWITDGGLNAIVTVDASSGALTVLPLQTPPANLNTAAFDGDGFLWFTGQAGFWGRVDPATGTVDVWPSPGGSGPYGIATTPDGTVWIASLAGSWIGRIDGPDNLDVVDTPTPGGGARRVWSDASGDLWVTEWFADRLARYEPDTGTWTEFDVPGSSQPYAVYVDERDHVWVSDHAGDALHRFDPVTEEFATFPHAVGADIRQLLGRPGEVWGAGSGDDTMILLRTD